MSTHIFVHICEYTYLCTHLGTHERVMVEVTTLLFFFKGHLKLLEKNLNFKNRVVPTDGIFLENLEEN